MYSIDEAFVFVLTISLNFQYIYDKKCVVPPVLLTKPLQNQSFLVGGI